MPARTLPAYTVDDDRFERLMAATGIARSFLAERPMTRGQLDGVDGIFVTVRLTSYRSLPLSCIEAVTLSIDGRAIDAAGLRLIVAGVPYPLATLADLPDRWWFVLDLAQLFVPHPDLADGEHRVDAVLVTVEPYMTAGRFSMFNPDRRRLVLGSAR